ncbi:hypothetical protein [Pedobacter soli]|uniref:Uncharacterized protein n=1 Tax=Pedobacter soli TaxID=390242 RepID=A0A1G6VK66_9SPHI|nr:hypothetical protein [Pedobacter soli]SDD53427.1 hypothetical protein SAMN04488024_106150 [Pedobacter soli]
MDYSLATFLIALLLIVLVAMLPLLLIVLISRKKLKKRLKYATILVLSIIQLWIFYSIYTAFYPEDSFYFEEYVTVVGKQVPKSAKIIDKSASYPDIHGKYTSVSLIKLSDSDYKILINEINKGKNFEETELIHTETLNDILDPNKGTKEITWKERKVLNESWKHHFIGFLSKQKMIIIYYINL